MKAEGGHPGLRTSERFSTDVTVLVYDLQFRPDAPDVAFWLEWCKKIGGPVLELGCGNGRIAIPLARAGLEVVGVDLSEPMLEEARSRLAAEPRQAQRRLRFILGDMRSFDPGREVRCAIIPAHTFSVLLTRQDQERMLAAVRKRLAKEGRLAFDLRLFSGEWLRHTHELPPVRRVSDDKSVDFMEERYFRFDPASGVLTTTNTYTFRRPAGLGRIAEYVKGRVLSEAEVKEVLESAGFVVEALWGDYDRRPFSADSSRMIFVARRR